MLCCAWALHLAGGIVMAVWFCTGKQPALRELLGKSADPVLCLAMLCHAVMCHATLCPAVIHAPEVRKGAQQGCRGWRGNGADTACFSFL